MAESRLVMVQGVELDLDVLEDDRLSWKAKGVYTIYCKLQQKEGIISPTVEDIRRCGKEGDCAIASALKELKTIGVIKTKPKKPQNFGYVYLAYAEGTDRYKIGLSQTPMERVREINKISPVNVQMIHFFPVARMGDAEEALHEKFAQKRVKGEWFALNEDDIAYIKAISSQP